MDGGPRVAPMGPYGGLTPVGYAIDPGRDLSATPSTPLEHVDGVGDRKRGTADGASGDGVLAVLRNSRWADTKPAITCSDEEKLRIPASVATTSAANLSP
jgi:hypothetical protein